jgi:hypothetical protein
VVQKLSTEIRAIADSAEVRKISHRAHSRSESSSSQD